MEPRRPSLDNEKKEKKPLFARKLPKALKAWPLQDAKARLSELVKAATSKGPQEITVRGEPTVVVLSKEEYVRLTQPKPSFIEFMRSSPLADIEFDIERDRSLTREIDL